MILDFDELPAFRGAAAGKRIVLAGGAFDLLHPGHIEHLRWARSLGDILVVHVTEDSRYQEKRGTEPLFAAKERAQLVDALKPVDAVFVTGGRHYDERIVDAVRPDVLAFGPPVPDQFIREEISFEGEIALDDSKKRYSSTDLKNQASPRM